MRETRIIQRLEEEMRLHKKTREERGEEKKEMGSHVSFDDTPSTIEKNLNETNSLAYGKSAFGG